MKTRKSYYIVALAWIAICGNSLGVINQYYINNIQDALAKLDTTYQPFTFDRNGATVQDSISSSHIQGVAYANGYYYVVRSRPEMDNNQKLLIIDEASEQIVQTFDLESTSAHPGGIQIYNNILAVGFSTGSNSSKINFYDLTNPVSPVLAGSYNAPVKTICLGLTGYEDKYLVAQYYGRTGSIRFYHFDQSFNKIDEQVWLATEQDKSDWYPSSSWKDHTPDYYGYENMMSPVD